MTKKIRKIVIVGGGTSGWLTAAILAKKLLKEPSGEFEIHLVESSDIPTIGVGEGTFPTMLDTLQYIGISEIEFLTCCQATFKQGIKFDNWLHTPNSLKTQQSNTLSGQTNSYYHLFNPPVVAENIDVVSNWVASNNSKVSYAHAVSAQAYICDNHLAPKLFSTPEFKSKTRYAYHLDAGKFVELLKKHATLNLGIQHHIATVKNVFQDEQGNIGYLISEDEKKFEADLFVDCSGFASLLIGKTLDSPFIDVSDILFVDSAIAIQVPYTDLQQEIPSYTLSTAHEAGWTWDIGLASRRGVGYVYSSKYSDHNQAEKVVRNYIAEKTGNMKLSEDLPARHIPMRIGYRQKCWVKNCVAIGFSGGFVEPLEATAISMVETAAMLLAGQFPDNDDVMPAVAKKYNQIFELRWEKIVEFIKLHYCLSRRDDNAFWTDNCNPESIPESLRDKLALWKTFPPQENDFASRFEMFTLSSYQYVLYGMRYNQTIQKHADIVSADNASENFVSQKIFSAIQEQGKTAKVELPGHRELINHIYQKGNTNYAN